MPAKTNILEGDRLQSFQNPKTIPKKLREYGWDERRDVPKKFWAPGERVIGP